jgi:hypothetical protein
MEQAQAAAMVVFENGKMEAYVGPPGLRGRIEGPTRFENVAKCANSVAARLDRRTFVAYVALAPSTERE